MDFEVEVFEMSDLENEAPEVDRKKQDNKGKNGKGEEGDCQEVTTPTDRFRSSNQDAAIECNVKIDDRKDKEPENLKRESQMPKETHKPFSSPTPTNNQTSVSSSSVQTKTESWQNATIVQPYNGELCPKNLHGVTSFASIVAFNHLAESAKAKEQNPLQKVMSMLAPKLQELTEERRFQLKHFGANFVSKIGRGSFGEVFKQRFMGSTQVAMKRFRNYSDPLPIYKEVHLLIALQHKRIVQLLGAFHEQGTWLVMELCEGNIRDHLNELTPQQKVRFGIQLLEAVKYMHSLNIIHCDIKPDNIFITKKNNAVLGDFGNANLLPKGVEFITTHPKQPCLGGKGYSDVLANKKIYSKSTDMFGIGCTIFEMDCCYALMEYKGWPEAPISEYIRCVKEGRLLTAPNVIPDAEVTEFDGARETLLVRSQRSAKFNQVLPELIQDSYKRPSAEFILEKYKGFFTRSLQGVQSSWTNLDADPLPQGWKRVQDVGIPMQPQKCSFSTNLAMDLVYWDSKINDSNEDAPEEYFMAVKSDDLQSHIDQFLVGSLKSKTTQNRYSDGLTPCSSACKEHLPLKTGQNVSRASVYVEETQQKQDSCDSQEPIVCFGKYTQNNENVESVQHGLQAPLAPNSTLGKFTKEPHVVASLTDLAPNVDTVNNFDTESDNGSSSRKRKRQQHITTGNEKVDVTEQSIVLERSANSDNEVSKKTKKKKKKKGHKNGKHTEMADSKTKETIVELTSQEESSVNKNKEWFIKRNLKVPVELRGPAPSPTNLPDDFTPEDDWSGWFDCEDNCFYFTHDYRAICDHMSECPMYKESMN